MLTLQALFLKVIFFCVVFLLMTFVFLFHILFSVYIDMLFFVLCSLSCALLLFLLVFFFFRYFIIHRNFFLLFKQKTAYYMRISYWSSDVCSSDLVFRQTEVVEEFGKVLALCDVDEILDVRESCAESLDCVFVAVVLRFSQVAPNRAHIARFVDNAGHNMICLSAVNCVGGNLADDFAEFDHGLARGLGHDAADRHAPGSIGNIGSHLFCGSVDIVEEAGAYIALWCRDRAFESHAIVGVRSAERREG